MGIQIGEQHFLLRSCVVLGTELTELHQYYQVKINVRSICDKFQYRFMGLRICAALRTVHCQQD